MLLVVAGIIMNSVLSSVFERRKDLGTLKAMGASKTFILFMVLIEILFITLFAAGTGTVVSYLGTKKLMETGIYYGQASQIAGFVPEYLYPAINPLRWIFDIVFLFFWAVLWSLYPALLIAGMKPVKALREEL